MRYRFGNVELDTATYALRRAGRELSLQPKVFDVLRYLLEHRERLVSKQELLDAVWRDEHVNESAVPWSVSHARNALGQRRGRKTPIETVHGRGYRFTADVEVLASVQPPAAAPAAVPASLAAARTRPFVGRTDVMQRLAGRVAEAVHGKGHLCVLSGEAGIGKTRCGEELMAHAASLGCSTWVGRSVDDAGEPVFWPWIQILREAVRVRPDMRELGEPLLTRLAAHDPAAASATETGPERDEAARRFALLDEVTRFLLLSAQSTPIMLLIDDLQWADAGTLDLLGFLAPELQNARILVVATQRDEATRGSPQRLARLARYAEHIELTRLTPQDVGRYIAELAALDDPPAQLSQAVHRATTGNPLFVQETVRALVSEHGKTALSSLTPTAIEFPEVARDVLRKPLAALDKATCALLSQASVLGESFELGSLQQLSGVPLTQLLDSIEAATRQGLVVAETPQRYRFSHALVRALLYDEMPTGERVAYHRKAGEALEAMQSAEPRYSEIAQHFYRSLPAGAYDRVVAATRRAAAAAEASLAHADAVRFYEWALEAQALDPTVGPRDRAQLLFACGRAQRHAGRDGASRNTLARLFELARQHGYGDLLVRGARVLRPTFAMAVIPDPLVRNALEEVLKIANEAPDAQRISAMSQLACIPPYANDMPRSKQLSARALELARGLGDRGTLFESLRSRLYSLSGPDDIDDLLAAAGEILALDRERPSVMSIEAHSARLGALRYRCETVAADQALDAIERTARELRLPEAIWYCDRQRAQQRFLHGDFAGANAAYRELSARSARMGLGYGAWFIDTLQTVLAIEQVGLVAYAAGRDFSGLLADGPNLQPDVRARILRGAAELGGKSARPGLEVLAAQGFETIPKDISYLHALANVALAVVELSDLPRAEQVYALLAPYPKHNTPDALLFDQGSVSRYLGLLAACLRRDSQVEAHFEEALAMNRAMNRRSQIAHSYYELARWHAGRGSPGSAARAKELALEATNAADDLGMHWLAERARALSA